MYREKYLKYKAKYIALKKYLEELEGGASPLVSHETAYEDIIRSLLTSVSNCAESGNLKAVYNGYIYGLAYINNNKLLLIDKINKAEAIRNISINYKMYIQHCKNDLSIGDTFMKSNFFTCQLVFIYMGKEDRKKDICNNKKKLNPKNNININIHDYKDILNKLDISKTYSINYTDEGKKCIVTTTPRKSLPANISTTAEMF
jgi:hypothetical protein